MKAIVKGLALVGIAFGLTGPLSAEEPFAPLPDHRLEARFQVYFGGFHIMAIDYDRRVRGEVYEATGGITPKGLLKFFTDLDSDAVGHGLLSSDGTVRPRHFHAVQTGPGFEREVTITYDDEGPTHVDLTVPDDEDAPIIPNLNDPMMKGVLDPLAAALFNPVFTNRGDNVCEGQAVIFDGGSRYDLTFSPDRPDVLEGGEGRYNGPAMKCDVTLTPIGAYDERSVEDLEKFDEDVAVLWVGRLTHDGDGNRLAIPLLVPAKVLVRTSLGNLVAHLELANVTTGRKATLASY